VQGDNAIKSSRHLGRDSCQAVLPGPLRVNANLFQTDLCRDPRLHGCRSNCREYRQVLKPATLASGFGNCSLRCPTSCILAVVDNRSMRCSTSCILAVVQFLSYSFPRSAWERSSNRSCGSGRRASLSRFPRRAWEPGEFPSIPRGRPYSLYLFFKGGSHVGLASPTQSQIITTTHFQ
jgi:hypothetical protein